MHAWIADSGHACFRDESDVAVLESGEDGRGALLAVALRVAEQLGSRDTVTGQQLADGACVLGGDQGDFAQDAEGAQRYVL